MPSRSCLHSAFHLRDVITRKQHVLLVSSVWLLANLFSSTLRSALVTRTFQCNWFSPFSRPLATATGYARSMPEVCLVCLSFLAVFAFYDDRSRSSWRRFVATSCVLLHFRSSSSSSLSRTTRMRLILAIRASLMFPQSALLALDFPDTPFYLASCVCFRVSSTGVARAGAARFERGASIVLLLLSSSLFCPF